MNRRAFAFYLVLSALSLLLVACATQALAEAHGVAVATGDDPSVFAPVDDAFTAGRRSGFLFVGIGIGVAALAQAILVRLKPKGTTPAGWRAKLTIALGAVSMVALALVDMFAEQRGLTPVVTAAVGGLALWRHAAPDPERGSKRQGEASGEIDGEPQP